MKRLYFKLLVIGTFIGMVACDSVFVPDPIDPRIPKYTEKGNNVAGAYVNDCIWKSEKTWVITGFTDAPSFTVWPASNSVVICFTGSVENSLASIEFHLKDLDIFDFEDLPKLNGQKITIDGYRNVAYYNKGSYNSESNEGSGQLYMKNVQMNDSLTAVIFSGTFGFTVADTLGNSTKISYGRFDYLLGKDNEFVSYTPNNSSLE